jgi:NAD(P)H-nitrite reductase large subunit
MPYDKLLLATGAVTSTGNWPGVSLEGVTGFVSYQDCKNVMRLIKRGGHAVVVGGGLIGIELCEVFRHYQMDVTFLIRGPYYWHKALSPEEGQFVEKEIKAQGITIITGDELTGIHGWENKVEYIMTKTGKKISCNVVGIATGVKPEMTLAQKAGIPCNKGILTNPQLETKVKDIFAAGDCAEIEYPAHGYNEAVWYIARDMGRIAGYNMCGNSLSYYPGMWYNSALFFTKEYTAVGRYGPLQSSETDYYYRDNKHSIRIILQNNIIKGFSLIGSRWEHQVLMRFIREKKDLEYFLTHYQQAQFNPEFHSYPILHNRK